MNSAIDDERATRLYQTADLISAQSIPGVNSDAYYIARLHPIDIQMSDRLVPKDGIAEIRRRGRSQNEKPSRCYHGGTEGGIARVD